MASVNTLQHDEQNSFEDHKVRAWLHTQPTHCSTAIESATKASTLTPKWSSRHKRKYTRAADRDRRPLQETTMNSSKNVESHPPKRKKPNASSQLPDRELAEAGYSRALQRDDIPLLLRRGTKSNSSTQSRSSSLVKTIYDLTMADPPITFFEANSKAIQPPVAVSQLYKKVLDVSDGFNLLPKSLKDSIITYCKEFETRIPRNEYFQKPSNPARKPTQEELHT